MTRVFTLALWHVNIQCYSVSLSHFIIHQMHRVPLQMLTSKVLSMRSHFVLTSLSSQLKIKRYVLVTVAFKYDPAHVALTVRPTFGDFVRSKYTNPLGQPSRFFTQTFSYVSWVFNFKFCVRHYKFSALEKNLWKSCTVWLTKCLWSWETFPREPSYIGNKEACIRCAKCLSFRGKRVHLRLWWLNLKLICYN